MSPGRDFVLEALLRYNYFPNQKKHSDELPPLFTSASFSVQTARALVVAKQRNKKKGWDTAEYKITRFNGVSRCLAIPHPLAHAHLSLCIYEHWDKLKYIANNPASMVCPRRHKDGRVIVMDYDNFLAKATASAQRAFGKRFTVHTDISNCFPTIYSHALPWATVGFNYAKAHRGNAEWFNQLDETLRGTKRNETQGVAIGPATSNIVTEAILARVDEALRKLKFTHIRYVDDYTAYCETEAEAQEFTRNLSFELSKYKLLLSVNKTKIGTLPQPISNEWIIELAASIPSSPRLNSYDALRFLDHAVDLAKKEPEGSVLKYAIRTLLRKNLTVAAHRDLLHRALELSFHQPALLPLLKELFQRTLALGKFYHSATVHALAEENARFHRSDGMCWSLYYLNLYAVPIQQRLADNILASKDCLSLLLLYKSGQITHRDKVVDFAKKLDQSDHYELDQYWPLLYQLFLDGLITNPYVDEDTKKWRG